MQHVTGLCSFAAHEPGQSPVQGCICYAMPSATTWTGAHELTAGNVTRMKGEVACLVLVAMHCRSKHYDIMQGCTLARAASSNLSGGKAARMTQIEPASKRAT